MRFLGLARIALILSIFLAETPLRAQQLQTPTPLPKEIPARVRLFTDKKGVSVLSLWSEGENPQELLEFKMAWNRYAAGVFDFNGSVLTKGSLAFRAVGTKDRTGILNVTHFHEARVRSLPNINQWKPLLKVSGQINVLAGFNVRTPTLVHVEPTNARIDFTLPLRRRGQLLLGAEAGPWIEGLSNDLEIVPGGRATIRLTF